MKRLCFKFHQNRTINQEFDFSETFDSGITMRKTLFWAVKTISLAELQRGANEIGRHILY